MSYEVWQGKGKHQHPRDCGPATVRFVENGQVVLNKPAAALFWQRKIVSVVFLWDREGSSVALKPVEKDVPNGHSVTYHKGGSQAKLRAAGLLQHIDAEPFTGPVTWNEDLQLFEIPVR